jgi:hypothetical protein
MTFAIIISSATGAVIREDLCRSTGAFIHLQARLITIFSSGLKANAFALAEVELVCISDVPQKGKPCFKAMFFELEPSSLF